MTTLTFAHTTNDNSAPWLISTHIFTIITSYLQPSPADTAVLSASDAAQKLDSLFPTNRSGIDGDEEKKESPGSFLAEFWDVIIMVVQQIPASHPLQDKLIALLKALSELPTETVVDIWEGESRVWQDLPLMGPNLVEAENYISQDQEPEKWRNFNAFCARLTRGDVCDMSLIGTHTLSKTLEDEPDPRARAYHAYREVFKKQVPVAALWIEISGEAMWKRCKGDISTEGLEDGCRGRLWKGKPLGLSMERWEFWKDRWAVIGEHPVADEETKEQARRMHEVMVRVEREAAL